MDSKSLVGKRILVTGGSGFLGKKLVSTLKSHGSLVFNISYGCAEDDFNFNLDITDYEKLSQIVQLINPDLIFHLAASIDRNRDYIIFDQMVKINLLGTSNLLRSLQNINYTNFIFTSSSEIYGNNGSPFFEDFLPDPVSPYSLTKVFDENLISTFSKAYNKNYTILRLFNFYGIEMPESFFIPQLVNTLVRDEDFLMTSGEQLRDFIHIDDVLSALVLCGLHPNSYNQIFNVCSGEGLKLRDLATIVANNMGKQNRLKVGALNYRNNEVWEMIGSNKKIYDLLGFSPIIKIEDGINEIIDSLTN
jgi:nucleoside-diphosphate-sugar epimerase